MAINVEDVASQEESNVEVFELATVAEAVAQLKGCLLLSEVSYIVPPVTIFGETCFNPAVKASHTLKHPAIYMAEVSDYKMIGGAAFPIIHDKSIYHQNFSTDTWETWEQALGVCRIRLDQNLIGYTRLSQLNQFDCAVINLVGNGSFNYAHWLTEFLPQLVLLKRAGKDLSQYKVLICADAFPSMLEALYLLGIVESQLIFINYLTFNIFSKALWVSPVANVVFQRPNAINNMSDDMFAEPQHATFHPEVIQATRDTYIKLLDKEPTSENLEKIFIKRAPSHKQSARTVTNEGEIQLLLEAQGFVTVETSRLGFLEQIRLFSHAKFIVAASGAALVNMIWAPAGAKIVVLMNDSTVANYWYFSNIAYCAGHELGYVLGRVNNSGAWIDINHADYEIKPQALIDALRYFGLETVTLDNLDSTEISQVNPIAIEDYSGHSDEMQQAINEVLQLALQHQQAGRIEQAGILYQEILAIQADHAEANHYLGIIEAHSNGALAALPMLEIAVQKKPESEQFWVTYIDALVQAGGVDTAIEALVLGQNYGLAPDTAQLLIAEYLSELEHQVAGQTAKKLLALHMQGVHKKLLAEIKGKQKLKVVFFAIHTSVWKLDTVFQAMLSDVCFEPIILVCPYVQYGYDRMMADLEMASQYFQTKGYPVINSYNKETDSWIQLEDLAPDLIFFTNPHAITKPEYYDLAYKQYLTCYVPYDHQVSYYGGHQDQYNQFFHNAMWMIFVPHVQSYDIFTKISAAGGKNVIVTGYPACEPFVSATAHTASVWKAQDTTKLKLIWAPHHTIDSPELPYSNFLKYADFFQALVKKYEDKIQWAFKPHPILKSKLYEHPNWGKEKTDQYYAFWKTQANTQLEEGEYKDLFIESDGMIHDSGSFLAEYLYLKKPVLYLVSSVNVKNFFNAFGIDAFNACEHAYIERDIINFIESDLGSSMIKINEFYRVNISPYFQDFFPTSKIISTIKDSFRI